MESGSAPKILTLLHLGLEIHLALEILLGNITWIVIHLGNTPWIGNLSLQVATQGVE